MIIEEKVFTLRDGRSATIRSPKAEDAKSMIRYMRRSTGETDFLTKYPEECVMTEEDERCFIEHVNGSERDMMPTCIVDGQVVATAYLSCRTLIKTRHRAEVGLAVLKEYWGQGIGTRLLRELIAFAEADRYITQLELEYYEGNDRARVLYEKLGFHESGFRPNAIRFKDGTMLNEYMMVRGIEKR